VQEVYTNSVTKNRLYI